MQAVDPAVDDDLLAALPGVLDDGRLTDVERLLDDVELAEGVDALRGRQRLEPGGMAVAHVLDVADPVVGQADAPVLERGPHPAALRMADDDDVQHLQHLGRELDHREAIQVGMNDDVGDVAVHEQLARHEVDQLVGGDAAVGAADPEIARRLLAEQAGEEAGARGLHLLRPAAVALEQLRKAVHGSAPRSRRQGAPARRWRTSMRRSVRSPRASGGRRCAGARGRPR